MEEIEVVLGRHEQQIKTLERDMTDMKTVQAEIRSMHDTLVTLTTELKHANEHLARHEQKIDEIKSIPGQRMQQICMFSNVHLPGQSPPWEDFS
jgi:chromosome segregation ATPase